MLGTQWIKATFQEIFVQFGVYLLVVATPYLVILFMCTQCVVYSECQTDVDGATALPATGTTKCFQDSNAKAKVPPN